VGVVIGFALATNGLVQQLSKIPVVESRLILTVNHSKIASADRPPETAIACAKGVRH